MPILSGPNRILRYSNIIRDASVQRVCIGSETESNCLINHDNSISDNSNNNKKQQ